MDRLTPPAFTRIRTPFVLTWLEDNAVVNNLDWGAKSFSVYLPESLRVVQAIYLKIECPATSGANFKDYSGLQVIKSIRVLSGGTEAYVADVEKYLVDYCQSLTEEQLKEFARIHLGGSTSPGSGARTYILPILLPNSPYMLRNGHDTRGLVSSHASWDPTVWRSRLPLTRPCTSLRMYRMLPARLGMASARLSTTRSR